MKWIAFKEQRPPVNTRILVVEWTPDQDKKEILIAENEYRPDAPDAPDDIWIDDGAAFWVNGRYSEITHWMPLPEMPEN